MDDRMDNFADDLNHIALDQVFSCPRKDSNLRTRFRNPIEAGVAESLPVVFGLLSFSSRLV